MQTIPTRSKPKSAFQCATLSELLFQRSSISLTCVQIGPVQVVRNQLRDRLTIWVECGPISHSKWTSKSKFQDSIMADAEKPKPRPISVDDSKAVSSYANFCRVTGSPEELIVDFGMNSQPMGGGEMPVQISQRIVLNFYTAKRLLHALHVSVQRHEEVFGKIETDIQKRVVPQEKKSKG